MTSVIDFMKPEHPRHVIDGIASLFALRGRFFAAASRRFQRRPIVGAGGRCRSISAKEVIDTQVTTVTTHRNHNAIAPGACDQRPAHPTALRRCDHNQQVPEVNRDEMRPMCIAMAETVCPPPHGVAANARVRRPTSLRPASVV